MEVALDRRLFAGWVLTVSLPLAAQCSDAGLCVLERAPETGKHRIGLTGQVGRSGGPDDLTFQTLRLEGQFRLGDRTALSLTLPYGKVRGPLGETTGWGDALVVLEQALPQGDWGRLSGQAGVRLPTGREDAGGLPQRYQAGLGGTDLLLGVRWEAGAWDAGLGYQKAGRRSGNPVDPLERGDDLLLHVGRRGRVGPFEVQGRTLAIRRLQTANVREPDGTLRSLPGSDRLQINLVGAVSLPLDARWSLESRMALPLLKRPDNTDGLKRAFTVELGASYRF